MTETTKPKKFCFILMPFDEKFDDVYKLGIKQSCVDAGAYCERVDEQIFNETILERIYNQISKADVVIADMTGRNPNIFYEVGYAHALGKTTVLLTQEASDIPFDLKHYPHIIYNNKILKLKDELTQRVKWYVENETNTETDYKIDFDLFLESENLSSGSVIYTTPTGKKPYPKLIIQNKTFRTYKRGDYRIGVITDKNYRLLEDISIIGEKKSSTTTLPDGKLLHMLPYLEDILFPNSYTSFNFLLLSKSILDQDVIIRLFTNAGTRDYPLRITYEQKRTPAK